MKNESDADERERILILLQTQLNQPTPVIMIDGKGYKPIELVKREHKAPIEFEENFELLEEINEILMN